MRARRARAQKRKGLALIASSLVVFIGAGVFFAFSALNRIEVDSQTQCPTSGHEAHSVVLLDVTDPLDALQTTALREQIDQLINNLPKWARISVYFLGEHPRSELGAAISVCNPGAGSEFSWWNSNPIKRQEAYEQFKTGVLNAVGDLSAKQPLRTSPIFEMLTAVSITAFRGDGTDGKELFVFSDFVQNSENFSRFKHAYELGLILESPTSHLMSPSLRDVNVHLRYFSRTSVSKYQKKADALFWEEYFAKFGGLVRDISFIDRY